MKRFWLVAMCLVGWMGCADETDTDPTGEEQQEIGDPVSCDDGPADGEPCANPGAICEEGCAECYQTCSAEGLWEEHCHDGESELEPPCG